MNVYVTNGRIDSETGDVLDRGIDDEPGIEIPHRFDPAAKCERWLQFVEEVFEGNKKKAAVLQEFFGYCLTVDSRYQKALVLLGDGANGKSVAMWVLRGMLGDSNVTATGLAHLQRGNYPFRLVTLAQLNGKLASVSSGRLAVLRLPAVETIKAVVAGWEVCAKVKYGPIFSFIPFCKMLFMANGLGALRRWPEGISEKILILRFERCFEPLEQDVELARKLKDECSGILTWSIHGLKRLRAVGEFTPLPPAPDKIG